MAGPTHSRTWAALTYALAAVAPIGSWLLLMFHATPTSQSPLEGAVSILRYTFSPDAPERWWFFGWAALPICFIVLAGMYLSPLSRRRNWAIALFGAALVATGYSLAAVPPLGAILLVALYLSYRCIHDA